MTTLSRYVSGITALTTVTFAVAGFVMLYFYGFLYTWTSPITSLLLLSLTIHLVASVIDFFVMLSSGDV